MKERLVITLSYVDSSNVTYGSRFWIKAKDVGYWTPIFKEAGYQVEINAVKVKAA